LNRLKDYFKKGIIKMFYIQRRDFKNRTLETVDEFTTRKEARLMCYEYIFSDQAADYYISTRPCSDWREEKDLEKIEKICKYY
jgi:tRNA U38,U39,U40 pseudouridine synthase TruA